MPYSLKRGRGEEGTSKEIRITFTDTPVQTQVSDFYLINSLTNKVIRKLNDK